MWEGLDGVQRGSGHAWMARRTAAKPVGWRVMGAVCGRGRRRFSESRRAKTKGLCLARGGFSSRLWAGMV